MFIFSFLVANFNSVGFLKSVYIPELVPPKGVSYSFQAFWLSATFISVMFPLVKYFHYFNKLRGWVGISYCFMFFTFNCWVAELVMYKFTLETANKNETEIDNMFEEFRKKISSDRSGTSL